MIAPEFLKWATGDPYPHRISLLNGASPVRLLAAQRTRDSCLTSRPFPEVLFGLVQERDRTGVFDVPGNRT